MNRPRRLLFCCLSLCAAFSLISCSEQSLNKQQAAHRDLALAEDKAAAAATISGDAAGAAAHAKAAADERARVADLETKRAAARDADTKAWTAGVGGAGDIGNLFWPGVAGIVGLIATPLIQKLRGTTHADGVVLGQAQGATMATTAITHADTGDVLQPTAVIDRITSNLAGVGAPANVVAAVSAAI